jgi:hypothetical protein
MWFDLTTKRTLIGWKISFTDIGVASIRYRCLVPVLALRTVGIEACVFSKVSSDVLEKLSCLVFVKSFKPDDYVLALQASNLAIPVVLDICDNIFVAGYGIKNSGRPGISPKSVFIQMAELATMIVVPTESLAEIVRKHASPICPIVVIPDGVVTKPSLAQMTSLLMQVKHEERIRGLQRFRATVNYLRDRLLLLKTVELEKFVIEYASDFAKYHIETFGRTLKFLGQAVIKRYETFRLLLSKPKLEVPSTTGVHRIVWFGHHGANYARFGMLDLLSIRDDLESVSKQHHIELIVISNSRKKFDQHIRPFGLPTRFLEWSAEALEMELSHAAAVVIPNSLDDFSMSKSPNRAVLALLSGVPVVATATPALMELKTCIVLNEFVEGLKIYISNPVRRLEDVKAAQGLIHKLYGDDQIREHWLSVIGFSKNKDFSHSSSSSPVLIVVLHSQLDWVLLKQVVREALRQGLSVGAILDARFSDDVVILFGLLRNLGVHAKILHPDRMKNLAWPTSVRALVCATESNLMPHRLAHKVALQARKVGVYTTVLQHGYEAPGLTYHDNFHSIRKVSFASERIYLWGSAQYLHPLVPASTREKCLTVGLPCRIEVPDKGVTGKDKTWVVGVFENLHWKRYSESYKLHFITGLRKLAMRYPEVSFIISTHPRGEWLLRDNNKSLFKFPNVTFSPQEGGVEERLGELFNSIDCVITTPSTLALQAAQAGLPVAVVDGGLNLSLYSPLTLLINSQDWVDFTKRVMDYDESRSLLNDSSDFVARVIYPGNAARSIISDICAHI